MEVENDENCVVGTSNQSTEREQQSGMLEMENGCGRITNRHRSNTSCQDFVVEREGGDVGVGSESGRMENGCGRITSRHRSNTNCQDCVVEREGGEVGLGNESGRITSSHRSNTIDQDVIAEREESALSLESGLSHFASNYLERDSAGLWDRVVQNGANQEGGSQFSFSVEALLHEVLSGNGDEDAVDNEDKEAINKDLA